MIYSDLGPLTRMEFAYEIGSQQGAVSRVSKGGASLFLDREDRSFVYLANLGLLDELGGEDERWEDREEEARRRRAGRWQTGKAGRHQAMDEMLTRRETIDYSRRGRRRKGVVGREMVFLYRSRRQANRSEFIPPAKYVRRVPSRVYPPTFNRSFEELLLSLYPPGELVAQSELAILREYLFSLKKQFLTEVR